MFKHSHEGLPVKNNQFVVLSASARHNVDFHCITSLSEERRKGLVRLSPVCARASLRLGLRMSQPFQG